MTVVVSLLGLVGCYSERHPKPAEAKPNFVIKVVGDDSAKRAVEDAKLADFFSGLPAIIEFVPDSDTTETAKETASELRDDPTVLAVVGHSRSGTTLAALPLYAQAGIPVIMPAATSPDILVGPNDSSGNSQRFSNAFRLPPNDVPNQANAIQLMVKELNEKHSSTTSTATDQRATEQSDTADTKRLKLMLICDVTKRTGADVYTSPICGVLRKDKSFGADMVAYHPLEMDTGDIYGFVTEIHVVNPDILVVVAYQDMARDLLQELRERAEAMAAVKAKSVNWGKSYSIIVSDVPYPSKVELAGFGYPVYLPSSDSPHACSLKGYSKLSAEKKNGLPSEEAYTFDRAPHFQRSDT